MNADRYKLIADEEEISFEFTSVGRKGEIKKIIQYERALSEEYYNLGFGDWDEVNGKIDDEVVSNNGDSMRILATVVSTLDIFFLWHPNASVFATGSTEVRTRLYRIAISNNLFLIKPEYKVYGRKNNQFFPFEKDCNYDAFLIRKNL